MWTRAYYIARVAVSNVLWNSFSAFTFLWVSRFNLGYQAFVTSTLSIEPCQRLKGGYIAL